MGKIDSNRLIVKNIILLLENVGIVVKVFDERYSLFKKNGEVITVRDGLSLKSLRIFYLLQYYKLLYKRVILTLGYCSKYNPEWYNTIKEFSNLQGNIIYFGEYEDKVTFVIEVLLKGGDTSYIELFPGDFKVRNIYE